MGNVQYDVSDASAGCQASAATQAYGKLRKGILSGRLAPGSKLTEVMLATSLGMSRTPVREAVKRLIFEGLLTRERGAGLRVTSVGRDEISQIFEIRVRLESYAARRAAIHATEDQLAVLRELACAMSERTPPRNQSDYDAISHANAEFHKLIIDAARSPRLAKLVSSAMDLSLVLRTYSIYTSEDLQRSSRHHHEITDAIASRAPDWAEVAMKTHLRAAASVALRRMPDQELELGERARSE